MDATLKPAAALKDRSHSGLRPFIFHPSYFILSALLLSACARHLTNANLSCVQADMSPKEVESILGPPTRQETRQMEIQEDVKTLPVVRYFYVQNGKTVVIHFVDGKLIGQEGTFDQ
jgi:hypothetical protein